MVSHRPITAEGRLRSQACRCENSGGRSGTGTGFSFIFVISPIFCTHADQILLLAARQKGEASGLSRSSALAEVGGAFDTYASTFSCLKVALVWAILLVIRFLSGQQHTTKAPYSFSSLCFSYQKDKWLNSGNL